MALLGLDRLDYSIEGKNGKNVLRLQHQHQPHGATRAARVGGDAFVAGLKRKDLHDTRLK